MNVDLEEALTFQDVHLKPQYSTIHSREEVSLQVKLNNCDVVLEAPFIASPMDTVVNAEFAIEMQRQSGGLAILHRYCTIECQALAVAQVVEAGFHVGAAIGVGEDCIARAEALVAAGTRVLCVDVAHGHHILMKEALERLRDKFPSGIHIMAGNVATATGYFDLSNWGANSVRLGIGSGSICSTRVETGHGVPMLHNIFEVQKHARALGDNRAQIISDGGIREYGDITKALAAGAELVMMGSAFAGVDEAPGARIETPTGIMKTYRGMASKESQRDWRGYHSSNEGVSTTVPCKGPLAGILADMKQAVRSGLSYSGARDASELRSKAKFVRVTAASQAEAQPHILKRA